MVESYFENLMPAEVVIEIYTLLKDAGIELWVDGGWSVDALLGQQNCPHKDLDIAIQWQELVIPPLALPSQYLEELCKSELRLLMRQFQQRLNDRLVAGAVGLIAVDRAR